jgi:UDP-glucose 4-epimerase
MSDRILIIGGAGFVGSHLVDACLATGRDVVVLDNFSRGRREFLPANPALEVVEGDILTPGVVADTIQKYRPSAVYHLAAIHYIPECEQHPDRAIRINIEGTQNVLAACQGRVPRLIFASTGAIYDPALTDALNEESAIRTADIYGVTKLAGEHLVRLYVMRGHGRAIITRLFNAVGSRETNNHLIPAIMAQFAGGNRTISLGNLFPKRDYVHVQDMADAFVRILGTPAGDDLEFFNIGSATEYSVQELVDLCQEVIGQPITIQPDPSRMRKHDRARQLADITKLRTRTGWSPQRNLRQALEASWAEVIGKQPLVRG